MWRASIIFPVMKILTEYGDFEIISQRNSAKIYKTVHNIFNYINKEVENA